MIASAGSGTDADEDGIEDDLEARICGSADQRTNAYNLATEEGGWCPSETNLEVPPRPTIYGVWNTTTGPDEDGDGLVAYVEVELDHVLVDPGEPVTTTVEEEEGAWRIPMDPDDGNAEEPTAVTVCRPLPFVAGATPEADEDGDGFPSDAVARDADACVDRRDPEDVRLATSDAWRGDVDPDDGDGTVPEDSDRFSRTIVLAVRPGPDLDRDGVYANVQRGVGILEFTAEDPLVPTVTHHEGSQQWDPDDAAQYDPLPFLPADTDLDGVPDTVEPHLCERQDPQANADGYCPDPTNVVLPCWWPRHAETAQTLTVLSQVRTGMWPDVFLDGLGEGSCPG